MDWWKKAQTFIDIPRAREERGPNEYVEFDKLWADLMQSYEQSKLTQNWQTLRSDFERTFEASAGPFKVEIESLYFGDSEYRVFVIKHRIRLTSDKGHDLEKEVVQYSAAPNLSERSAKAIALDQRAVKLMLEATFSAVFRDYYK
jgi:hypothetical protein